jgi:hypothetical protein
MSSPPGFWRPVGAADPVPTYYVLTAVATFCYTLCFTVNLVYLIVRVGLDPLQLVLVGTVLEATCFLFEVPTGVVADRHSRRLSVLIGFVLVGLGFILSGALPTFGAILASQVLWGIGSTFTSGATVAWITDEIGPEAVPAVFTREQQIQLVAAFVGTVCSGLLSLIDLRLPLVLSGAGFLGLAVGLALRMPERGFAPAPGEARGALGVMALTARAGLRLARTRPVVRRVLMVSLLVGLAEEAFDRLWQLHLIEAHALAAVVGSGHLALWFSGVALAGIVVSLAASMLVNRFGAARLSVAHPDGLLAGLVALEVIGVLGVALSPTLGLALVALWLKSAARVITAPVLAAWLNRNVDSGVRATVLSLDSQANAMGQVVGGPPLGLLAGRASVRLALVVSAGILAPSVAIFAVPRRRA